MSRLRLACLLALFSVSACTQPDDGPGGGEGSGGPDAGAGGGSDGGGSGSDGGGDGGGGSIVPSEGVWTYTDVTPISSTCPTIVNQGSAGDFAITSASAAGFHVIPNDGSEPFDCVLTGATYACNQRALLTQAVGTAVITTRATATGTMSSAIVSTGRQDATVTCAGAGCAGIPLLPCAFTVSYVVRTL